MEYEKMLEVAKTFEESIKRGVRVFKPCDVCGQEAALGILRDKGRTLFLCDVHQEDKKRRGTK